MVRLGKGLGVVGAGRGEWALKEELRKRLEGFEGKSGER